MRIAGYARTGPAHEVLELRDAPLPEPGPGEIRLKVEASGINPHDTKGRAGWTGPKPEGFYIPHSDAAGVIDACGPGVTRSLGERVWTFGLLHGRGSAAEYICVPAAKAITLPGNISAAEGASLGVPALTAWLNILSDGPVTGEVVVVQGGGGAVGELTVELARLSGAQVLATSRSEAARARALSRGAAAVFAPDDPKLREAVFDLSNGRGAARVVEVDFNANQAMDVSLLADHGVLAAYSSTSDKFPVLDYYAFARKAARIRFVQGMKLTEAQVQAGAALLTEALTAGKLRPTISGAFPIAQIADSHVAVERGAAGNVVVTF